MDVYYRCRNTGCVNVTLDAETKHLSGVFGGNNFCSIDCMKAAIAEWQQDELNSRAVRAELDRLTQSQPKQKIAWYRIVWDLVAR